MISTILLALAISWPPNVEVSSGASCKVIRTSKPAGDCVPFLKQAPGVAFWWRACGYVEWAGRGPHGEDILAEMDLWSGNSRHKALGKCEQFLQAFEKKRGVRK